MARKSFLATLVGVTAFAVPAAFADKGGIPHDGSNGQGQAAAQVQIQAKAQGKALAKGHAKTHATVQAKGHANVHANSMATTHVSGGASSHGKALAKGHAKTNGSSQATVHGQAKVNTHAKAGKTTFCHATGSATNPYVTITTSNNALPAHSRHQDGRDIIPAPAGGCPGAGTSEEHPSGGESGKTTICHATGSATNPFVIITISNNALSAHQAHQDGRDIIPAPAGGCPGTTQEQLPPGLTPGLTPGAAPNTQGQAGVLGESTTSPAGTNAAPNNVNVLGASTGSAPSASTSPAATGTRASSSSGLPFTGTDAIIVAILGLAALLLGVTVRRATTNRA
jgi:hypothetical protein